MVREVEKTCLKTLLINSYQQHIYNLEIGHGGRTKRTELSVARLTPIPPDFKHTGPNCNLRVRIASPLQCPSNFVHLPLFGLVERILRLILDSNALIRRRSRGEIFRCISKSTSSTAEEIRADIGGGSVSQ